MEVRRESVCFGTVTAVGLSVYVVGALLFDPVTSWGGTSTTERLEPVRAAGGALVIAALAGWTAWRLQHHCQ